MTKILAILDTMWGMQAGCPVPRLFKISRTNHSGRRLYSLISGLENATLFVTNSCPIMVSSARDHGTPDPKFLRESLIHIDRLIAVGNAVRHVQNHIAITLVCGKVAQECFRACRYTPKGSDVIQIPHPAARTTWTREYIAEVQSLIKSRIEVEQLR